MIKSMFHETSLEVRFCFNLLTHLILLELSYICFWNLNSTDIKQGTILLTYNNI